MLDDPMSLMTPPTNNKSDVERAAKAMESYFLRSLLKEVKALAQSSGAGASTFQDMFREALADAMSEGQGLGIADIVAENASRGVLPESDKIAKNLPPGPQVSAKGPNLADGGE